MAAARLSLVGAVGFSLAACTATLSLDGLSGGDGERDAGSAGDVFEPARDGSLDDAGHDGAFDAPNETASDASIDASLDAAADTTDGDAGCVPSVKAACG